MTSLNPSACELRARHECGQRNEKTSAQFRIARLVIRPGPGPSPPRVAVTPRHHRVAATPPIAFFPDAGKDATPTDDEGVASTFLRRGVAATLPLRDSLIAAIARSRGHRIVTRDTTPFERMGCKVVDPWK